MDTFGLCFVEDDKTVDYCDGNSRWVVKLNNGQKVYSYDHHELSFEDSSWTRLKKYCEANSFYPTELYIHFRSNSIQKREWFNAEGYFMRRSCMGGFGMEQSIEYFLIGYISNGIVHIDKYQVPAMVHEGYEQRTISDCENSLIFKV